MPKHRRRPARRPTRKNSAAASRSITTHVRTLDGLRETRKFKTLAGAQGYAHKRIGAHPDLGSGYAVGMYGDITLSVEGATLRELFPEPRAAPMKEDPGPCESCGRKTDKGLYVEEGEWDYGRLYKWNEWHRQCPHCTANFKREREAERKAEAERRAAAEREYAAWVADPEGHPDYIPF